MSQELKLVISDSKNVIGTVSKETPNTHPAFMVKALNEFRQLVNTALTKLIEDTDNTSNLMAEEEGDSDSDEEDLRVSPKKRKK